MQLYIHKHTFPILDRNCIQTNQKYKKMLDSIGFYMFIFLKKNNLCEKLLGYKEDMF